MTNVLELRDVRHSYPDGTEAIRGITLSVAPGERVALLGPNGAGKSTLILHLNGVLRPSAGDVIVEGLTLSDATVREIRSRVGLVFQDPDDQLFMTTVYDDVAFGPLNMGLTQAEVDRRVHDALHAVGLAEVSSRAGQHLSFGQRKRVALATVLSMAPSLLVLDEPTSNLDPRARRRLMGLLRDQDATLVIATHDMDAAAELCERSVIVDGGVVVADGPSAEVLADVALLDAHGLEPPRGTPSDRASR